MSPSIEDLAYNAQESLDAQLTWMSIIKTWNYKESARFSWYGSQIQSSYLKSILSIYKIKPADQLPASELFGDNTTCSQTSIISSDQTSDKVIITNDSSSDDDIKHDSDVPEKLIDLELNRDSSVNSQADNLSTLPASPQKSDIIFDFEELVDLEFTNSTKELTKKIEDPIKLQEIPDQFQMFMEFANGNMESQSSLHLYDHETNSSFTSISSDFGEFVSAENVQTLPECSSFLPKFKEIASSVNDDNSLNPNLKQNLYNNSPELTPQDTWMSLSDLSFLEYITNTKTTSPKISSSEPHRDLLLDFNNFISLKSAK